MLSEAKKLGKSIVVVVAAERNWWTRWWWKDVIRSHHIEKKKFFHLLFFVRLHLLQTNIQKNSLESRWGKSFSFFSFSFVLQESSRKVALVVSSHERCGVGHLSKFFNKQNAFFERRWNNARKDEIKAFKFYVDECTFAAFGSSWMCLWKQIKREKLARTTVIKVTLDGWKGKQTSDKFHLALIFHPFIPAYLCFPRMWFRFVFMDEDDVMQR